MIVDVKQIDLLALADGMPLLDIKEQDKYRIALKCKVCGANVKYYLDFRDKDVSTFECSSAYYCSNGTIRRVELLKLTPSALNMRYHVWVEPSKDKIYKMVLEEHVGKQAFNYLREATEEEVKQAAVERLERNRQFFRSLLGIK